MIKRLNRLDKISDVIRASSLYLGRWFKTMLHSLRNKNDRRQRFREDSEKRAALNLLGALVLSNRCVPHNLFYPLAIWQDDPLFVPAIHPPPFLRYSRALWARHYFSLGSGSTVLQRLYIALCLLMPGNNLWRLSSLSRICSRLQ